MNKKFFLVFSLVMALVLFNPIGALATTANITQLGFTTDPRTVAPGTLSDVITVQTQNGSGGEEQIDETADLTFTSSSATGEFLNSSGNPVSTVMNKNSANRSFYYRDQTQGAYTLTVMVKARTSGTSWTGSQSITVGSGGGTSTTTDNNPPPPPPPPSPAATQTTGTNGASDYLSYSSPTPLSNSSVKLPFEINAGRKRLALVNAPLLFSATVTKVDPLVSAPRFVWSFGDGTTEIGDKVYHTYTLPGTYVVMLNAEIYGNTAVARTEVLVITPNLSLTAATSSLGAYLEINNKDKYDLNLSGFRLEVGGLYAILANDTIVAKGATVRFPLRPLGLVLPNDGQTKTVLLNYPDGHPLGLAPLNLESSNPIFASVSKMVAPQAPSPAKASNSPSLKTGMTAAGVAFTIPTNETWLTKLGHLMAGLVGSK